MSRSGRCCGLARLDGCRRMRWGARGQAEWSGSGECASLSRTFDCLDRRVGDRLQLVVFGRFVVESADAGVEGGF